MNQSINTDSKNIKEPQQKYRLGTVSIKILGGLNRFYRRLTSTCRALQKRFGEHYLRMKKPKPIDTFLYQHFKRTGHSPNDVLVQPVEKLTYDKNSSSRFKIIKRHETELKWIKLLQTPFPLGFNDNIYHEGNISKMPDFDVFSLLEIRKRKSRSHGIRKKGNGKRKKARCKEIKYFT